MGYILGLDTGGTFTDAALLEVSSGAVIAKAKAPTTRHDLSVGLGAAINEIIGGLSSAERGAVKRVCLSTTLATNAVVEGMGGRVGLVMIGFDESALERGNLGAVVKDSPVVFIDGGHQSDGKPQASLDMSGLDAFISRHGSDMSAVAIAGHFAVRNPGHEREAGAYIRTQTGLPVTCSHELSSLLGGPKRALTAFLNGRLIDMLARQIEATAGIIASAGLPAELMVVKGDGSLVSADFARLRPVETILSGPAASLSGAAHLVGLRDALVVDIGGTTTDIAVLEGGYPRLSASGARIGGWATMVEAADIRTQGLGGDSEVRLIDRGMVGGVRLGPRRVIPVSALAAEYDAVGAWLDSQLLNPVASPADGRFVVPLFSGEPPVWLTRSEMRMAVACRDGGVKPLADLAETRLALGAIDRLVSRGLVLISAFTPTDAALVLGVFDGFDRSIAMRAGALMARQRTGSGGVQAVDAVAFSEMVLERLTVQSSLAILDSAFGHGAGHGAGGHGAGRGEHGGADAASGNRLVEGLIIEASKRVHAKRADNRGADSGSDAENDFGGDSKPPLVRASLCINYPLIAMGASAGCHYPAIAEVLGGRLEIPRHADVAGAIGAAAGSIRQRATVSVTMPSDGIYRVHLSDGPVDFKVMDAALNHAESCAKSAVRVKAEAACGASGVSADISVSAERDVKIVSLSADTSLFIEAQVHGLAYVKGV